MSIDSISLTPSLNSSLRALTKTTNNLTQNLQSLSSGQKPTIDPTSFSASQSLLARVGDITSTKDSITNSITSSNLAQAGFQGVNQILQSAQGIASAAQSGNPADQAAFAASYQTLISQAGQLASDAGIGSTVSSVLPSNTLSATSPTELNSAISALGQQSAATATSLISSTTFQQFNSSLANIVQTGSDNLTLGDMNEQAVGILAQQTHQQLGINAVRLSNKSAESVLKLFGNSG